MRAEEEQSRAEQSVVALDGNRDGTKERRNDRWMDGWIDRGIDKGRRVVARLSTARWIDYRGPRSIGS